MRSTATVVSFGALARVTRLFDFRAVRPRIGLFVTGTLVGALVFLAPNSASAQATSEDEISVSVGGLIQAETSYGWLTGGVGEERGRFGFGLRRTRLRVSARIRPQVGAFIHLDADQGSFGALDVFLFYEPTEHLRLRLGRMASAQPRALILTPVIAMDATERAAIALLWNGGTLGSKARDFGIDLRYQVERGEVILFFHNGDGSFNRLRGNFQQNIVGDVTGGVEKGLDDMAFSAYGAFRPPAVSGLEIGGYAGYNGSRNPTTAVGSVGRTYTSYATHVYWGATPGSQPIRLKADLIGVRYEALEGLPRQRTLGFSMLGALGVHEAAEVFGRFEAYDPNLEQDGLRDIFVTTGVSFSPSKLRGGPYSRERLTLGYSLRAPEDDDAPLNHLLVLQLQVNF